MLRDHFLLNAGSTTFKSAFKISLGNTLSHRFDMKFNVLFHHLTSVASFIFFFQ